MNPSLKQVAIPMGVRRRRPRWSTGKASPSASNCDNTPAGFGKRHTLRGGRRLRSGDLAVFRTYFGSFLAELAEYHRNEWRQDRERDTIASFYDRIFPENQPADLDDPLYVRALLRFYDLLPLRRHRVVSLLWYFEPLVKSFRFIIDRVLVNNRELRRIDAQLLVYNDADQPFVINQLHLSRRYGWRHGSPFAAVLDAQVESYKYRVALTRIERRIENGQYTIWLRGKERTADLFGDRLVGRDPLVGDDDEWSVVVRVWCRFSPEFLLRLHGERVPCMSTLRI